MNIIQLFSLLDLKKDQILEFDTNDYIRIEKKINFEKKINPEIDAKTSENLIFALKEYKEEFLFVMSNRILFNFFTNKNLSENQFLHYNRTVSDEKMKQFMGLFLAEDLLSFFSFKLSKGWFHYLEELDFLLGFKKYFSEELIYKMGSLVFSKLDFAIYQLAVSNTNKFSNIDFIKHRTFYCVLSHFTTLESDQKISKLLSLVIKLYNQKRNIPFFISVLQSMTSYKAFNENVNEVLIEYSNAVSLNSKKFESFYLRNITVVIIIILSSVLISKCS